MMNCTSLEKTLKRLIYSAEYKLKKDIFQHKNDTLNFEIIILATSLSNSTKIHPNLKTSI